MRYPALLSLILACAPAARTQTEVVVPARYASLEGESFTAIPFGRSTGLRVQHWYGPTLFSGKRKIRRVAFRAQGSTAFAAKGIELEVSCATSVRSPRAVSAAFGANRGKDFAVCFKRKKVQLPAVARAPGPRPFQVVLDLDKAFTYDPAAGGLLVEILVLGQQPGRYELDLGNDCASQKAGFGQPGCPGSNQRVPAADCPTRSLLWGGKFVLRLRSTPPSAAAAIFLGTIEHGSWLGIRIPSRLDSYGATGCTLNTDMALILAGIASPAGELRILAQLPSLPALVGRWVRYQGLALDRRANALGMTLSNAAKAQVCGPLPLVRVVATRLTETKGQVETGMIPVTRFTLQ